MLNRRQGNITVVLENVEDPHNISAVLRTCDAVGIQDVYVLTTKIPRHKKWGGEEFFQRRQVAHGAPVYRRTGIIHGAAAAFR